MYRQTDGITSETETPRPKQNLNSPLATSRIYLYYINTNGSVDEAITNLLMADAAGDIDAVEWMSRMVCSLEEMVEAGFHSAMPALSDAHTTLKYLIAAKEFAGKLRAEA